MTQNTTTRRGLLTLGAGLGASLATGGAALAQEQKNTAPLIVYAVRHAEKTDEGRDPELSEAGKARAAELARVLADVPFESIHSTPFLRTQGTAAPLAKAKGLEVSEYHPTRIVDRLLEKVGRTVLVVGHSNTTPAVLRELGVTFPTKVLGGYDDLFVVIVQGQTMRDRVVTLQHLHYGAPSQGGGHGPTSRPAGH